MLVSELEVADKVGRIKQASQTIRPDLLSGLSIPQKANVKVHGHPWVDAAFQKIMQVIVDPCPTI